MSAACTSVLDAAGPVAPTGSDPPLDGVEVLRVDLDAHRGMVGLLSADETARAARFHRAIDRDRFVAARAFLRLLLADRLDEDPEAVRIVAGPHGKPHLTGDQAVRFNLSHSGNDALFAFTSAGEVGVDIERMAPVDPLELAQTCFSEAERAELCALPPNQRSTAFFHGWVRKEAVIKADGRGVSMGLDTFSVTLRGRARVAEAPPGYPLARWRLQSLDVGARAHAAVAVRESGELRVPGSGPRPADPPQ